MSIRIVLADDHKLTRDGLRSLIDGVEGMEVVAEGADGEEVLEVVEESEPDVIIMDVAMPRLNGMEATRQITKRYPQTKVLALSVHGDRQFVASMLRAGAAGYLLKECAFEEVAEAVRAVDKGQMYLSPDITSVVVRDYLEGLDERPDSPASLLTDREREVLQLVAEGLTTKEIAETLHVSPKTIESHRQHLMEKLDIHNIAELTKFAVRHGITSAD